MPPSALSQRVLVTSTFRDCVRVLSWLGSQRFEPPAEVCNLHIRFLCVVFDGMWSVLCVYNASLICYHLYVLTADH